MLWHVFCSIVLIITSVHSQLSTHDLPPQYPDEFRRDHLKHEPTYFVMASKMVRPGQVYRVSVTVFQTPFPITVRASIQRDGIELASTSQELKQNIPETLLLEVPTTSVPGTYNFRVEGNVNGVLGGTAFMNETRLTFSQRSMTIFIQTDRPIYKQGQTVRFRALPITTGLKAFSDAVDIYMLDPNRKIVKRWLSRQTNLGAVSLEYPLSLQPVYGKWTLQVIAQNQVEEENFLVEEYYQTRYEVNVTMPSFFTDIEEYIYGTVEANYTSGVPVSGNLTLKASIEPLRMNYRVGNKPPVIEQVYPIFDGTLDFKFPMKEFERLIPQLDKSKVTVTAFVGERYLNLIEKGFSEALIYSSRVNLEFMGSNPQIFKPGMPFKVYVALSYQDGSAINVTRLARQKVQITPTIEFNRGQSRRLSTRHEKMSSHHSGIWEVNIDLETESFSRDDLKDIKLMSLEAFYRDDYTGEQARAHLKVYAAFSRNYRFLQVTTSTRSPKVGEYIIFHVRANYNVEAFSYAIVSKGIILLSGQEAMPSKIGTFAVALSPEMAPTATVVIYSVAREGEVVVDSLTFPVDGISKNNFNVTLNNKKDKSGDTIEVVVVGRPSSYVGLSALDKTLFDMKGGNEFGHVEVLQKMSLFDEGMNGTLSHVWNSKEGNLDKAVHFPAATYGIDAYTTLEYAGLIVFTDANITQKTDYCNISMGYMTCMDGGCFRYEKKCDGYNDCIDGSDEIGCLKKSDLYLKDFKMNRVKRIQRLYDNAWLWHDINIGPLGYYIFNIPVPEIPTRWMVSAFGMNTKEGFGITQDKTLEFSSARPFYMNVEMPSKIIQGEQIGIRVSVFNYMLYEIEALIVVANSPDYKFVHVESFGIVESFRPRTSYGEHQHLVFVKPGKTVVVYMPIVPTRLGDIDVTIMTKSQVAKQVITRTIHVEADGIPQYRHTTVQLDLSQGAYLIKYLDTNITETPIVPYRYERLYMFGSNRATVSVVGDVTGPAFATMPVNTSSLLRKPSWCGEQNMFNFAANLYTLLYLRLTGQRQPNIEKQAFKHLNIGYQRQLSYQLEDGSFVPFRYNSRPSVWLTAFCARIFYKAIFQEWEHFLYIDPDVISKAVNWLLDFQSPEGAFYETTLEPLDRKMGPSVDAPYGVARYRNISLTAHVLITLTELRDLRGQDLGSRLATAREQARRYLERVLPIVKNLEDPYELAIVSYALTLSNSAEANEALNYLDSRMKEESGLYYWGRERVKGPSTKIENTRPYIISRLPDRYDASNIETTAYGLLVHIERNSVIQREIVEWLNTQRLTDGGWASTQDTIIAMQALIEHAIQSRVRDVIDISVTIEVPSVPGFVKQVHIGVDNLSKQQLFEIPNAWGVVLVRAQGSGIALVQLSVQYNVDWPHLQTPPPVEAFALKVKGFYHGRNSSHIEISSCQRWTLLEESDKSGMAVLEVEIPTGYVIQQQDLDAYVLSGRARHLKEARFDERKVSLYFNYLDSQPTCISFTIQRWYPVANLTRWLPVRIYDYYAPERFNETMFDAYNLFVLSICHVCGSYQCPYCPVFSWSSTIAPNPFTLLIIIVSYFLWKSSVHKL